MGPAPRRRVEAWGPQHKARSRTTGALRGTFDATRLYDCRVSDFDGDVCGARGDVERLRPLLDATCASDSLRANELAWFTDRTPHERPPPPRRAASYGANGMILCE